MEADVAMSNVDTEVFMTSHVEDNTSPDKSWIFDYGSRNHKVMFNSKVGKKRSIVK